VGRQIAVRRQLLGLLPGPKRDPCLEPDLAVGGLIATVTIPAGQSPGVYSGLVYAESQPAPLGVLTIEVTG